MCEECVAEVAAPRRVVLEFHCAGFVAAEEAIQPPMMLTALRRCYQAQERLQVGWMCYPAFEIFELTKITFPSGYSQYFKAGVHCKGAWTLARIWIQYGRTGAFEVEQVERKEVTHYFWKGTQPTIWCSPCDNFAQPSPAHPCPSCGELCCDTHDTHKKCAGAWGYGCTKQGCHKCLHAPDVHYYSCENGGERFCPECYAKECNEPWCDCRPGLMDMDEEGEVVNATERRRVQPPSSRIDPPRFICCKCKAAFECDMPDGYANVGTCGAGCFHEGEHMRCAACCPAYTCSQCGQLCSDEERIYRFAIGLNGGGRGRCCDSINYPETAAK